MEQRRQVMLWLHLTDQQLYCPLRCEMKSIHRACKIPVNSKSDFIHDWAFVFIICKMTMSKIYTKLVHSSSQSNITLISKTLIFFILQSLMEESLFISRLASSYAKVFVYLYCRSFNTPIQYSLVILLTQRMSFIYTRVAIQNICLNYQWQPTRGLNTNRGYHTPPGNCKSLFSKELTLPGTQWSLYDKNVFLFSNSTIRL